MSDTIIKSINKIKTYVKYIENIKESLKAKFNIDNDVPFDEYINEIQPIPEEQITFYKSASYNYEAGNPEYTNIVISGITEPAAANGTYINLRPDYSGTTRKWQNNDYALSYDNEYGYWCIHNNSETANNYNAYFKAKNMATTEDGSVLNPYIWNNLAGSSEITSEIQANTIKYWEFNCAYLTLKANTTYKFGVIANIDGSLDYNSQLQNLDGSQLNYSYDSSEVDINGHTCIKTFEYTPNKDAIYMFGIWAEYGEVNSGYVKFVCYPAPEPWTNSPENPWEYEFESNNGSGECILSSEVIAGKDPVKTWEGYQVFKNSDSDGNAYYSYASTLTKNLKWNKLTPNPGEIFSEDASIKAAILTSDEVYPSNASVWKIDITSANTNYNIWVAANAGNIIDWGDGAQTTTKYAADSQSGAALNTAGVYSHTYTSTGTYMVKVIGDSVFRIVTCCASSGSTTSNNWVIEAIQLSKSLLSTAEMFSKCNSLIRLANTFQLPKGLASAYKMFYSVGSLIEIPTSLRLPNSCTNFEYFLNASALVADITHLFDDLEIGTHVGKNVQYMFYNCQKITGKLPEEKLWKDYTWYINGTATTDAFNSCYALLNTNNIPTTWN